MVDSAPRVTAAWVGRALVRWLTIRKLTIRSASGPQMLRHTSFDWRSIVLMYEMGLHGPSGTA